VLFRFGYLQFVLFVGFVVVVVVVVVHAGLDLSVSLSLLGQEWPEFLYIFL